MQRVIRWRAALLGAVVLAGAALGGLWSGAGPRAAGVDSPPWDAFVHLASELSSAQPAGRIAFVRGGDLWLWEAGQERQITRGKPVSGPRFSQEGRYISFWQDQALWVVGVSGVGPWRVDQPDLARTRERWAPTGATLAYRTGEGVVTVAVTEEGPRPPQLIAPGATWPEWSPDGERLAVVLQQDGGPVIAEVPRTGGKPRIILRIRYPRESPCGAPSGGVDSLRWSADGRWLSFYHRLSWASAGTDCSELAVVPVRGGEAVTVGMSPAYPDWVSWAPVGATLAFTDGVGRDAWKNKAVRLAPMPPRPPFRSLTPDGYADREPVWCPDGRQLAFTRSRAVFPGRMDRPAPEQAIWVVEVVSGRGRPVPGSADGMAPRWGRDGSLMWVTADPQGASLWFTPGPGERPRSVVREMDRREFSYYGQWGWGAFFDWWPASSG